MDAYLNEESPPAEQRATREQIRARSVSDMSGAGELDGPAYPKGSESSRGLRESMIACLASKVTGAPT